MTATETVVSEPVAIRVTRYRCPFCNRSHSKRAGILPHIPRCWHNPAGRGCGTCRHADRDFGESGIYCDADLSPMVPATDEDLKHTDDPMVTVRNCPGWEAAT